MRILLGDKLLEFTEEELDYMYLDEGNESEVYRYGDVVLKIYKPYCIKDRLCEEDVLKLSRISTKRILMPSEVIRNADNGDFIGYSLPYVEKYPRDCILRMKMKDFLSELDIVLSDVETLSKRYVDIEDLHVDNILYNGKFFIGDPGSFEFRRNSPVGRIYRDNISSLNNFVTREVFSLVNLSKAKRLEMLSMFDDYDYIGEQLRDDVKSRDTISAYVKRMTK